MPRARSVRRVPRRWPYMLKGLIQKQTDKLFLPYVLKGLIEKQTETGPVKLKERFRGLCLQLYGSGRLRPSEVGGTFD